MEGEKMVTEGEKSVATEDPTKNKPEEGDTVGSDDGGKAAPMPEKALVQSHPLENSWTFSFYDPSAKSKQAAWGTSIRPICTFSTVEEFWSLYNSIPHPNKLTVGADFHCFKHKIEPKWEDPICSNGGKWGLKLSQGKSDTPWLYTLLAMIGEQFDHGDEICGAVVNVRPRQDKISLWTKNAANEVAQVSIGRQWKQFLDYNDSIGFIFHDDAKKLNRNAKNRYTV